MNNILSSINLSILELVSVLLPGATGLFFIYKGFETPLKEHVIEQLGNTWFSSIAFFGAAYFIGYIFYSASSFLDGWYDSIKRRALKRDTEENKTLEFLDEETYKVKNPVYRLLFPHLVDTHNLIVRVVAFKNAHIGENFDGNKHQIIDAFQYAFRRLMIEQPLMFSEVERYHSTAKFFRSMTLVFLAGGIGALFLYDWKVAVGLLFVSLVSVLVFFNRWRKANHVAFKNVIIMEGLKNADK